MMLRAPWVLAVLLSLVPPAAFTGNTETSDPNKVQIVTSDIARFWHAFDDAEKSPDPAGVYQKEYFEPGTDGVRGFTPNRLVSPEHLAKVVAKYHAYYVATRPYMQHVADSAPKIRADLQKFKKLYPAAVFPNVYFVVGGLNSAGTSVDGTGMIMGAEMLSRPPTGAVDLPPSYAQVVHTADDVPGTVIHEFTHYNQKGAYLKTLLDETIHEGTADFMADIVEPTHVPKDQWAFGCAHEDELWKVFSTQRASTDYDKEIKNWLFSYDPGPLGAPPFIGYWLGSRIAQNYYETHGRSAQAISDLLHVNDFPTLLRDSGYVDHRVPCTVPTP
jgi:hypothetical protein